MLSTKVGALFDLGLIRFLDILQILQLFEVENIILNLQAVINLNNGLANQDFQGLWS